MRTPGANPGHGIPTIRTGLADRSSDPHGLRYRRSQRLGQVAGARHDAVDGAPTGVPLHTQRGSAEPDSDRPLVPSGGRARRPPRGRRLQRGQKKSGVRTRLPAPPDRDSHTAYPPNLTTTQKSLFSFSDNRFQLVMKDFPYSVFGFVPWVTAFPSFPSLR